MLPSVRGLSSGAARHHPGGADALVGTASVGAGRYRLRDTLLDERSRPGEGSTLTPAALRELAANALAAADELETRLAKASPER
jgi:hypothetical protein